MLRGDALEEMLCLFVCLLLSVRPGPRYLLWTVTCGTPHIVQRGSSALMLHTLRIGSVRSTLLRLSDFHVSCAFPWDLSEA